MAATPQISDLEKEHNQLKVHLCQKFTKFMLLMFILTSFIELTRAFYLAKLSIIIVPLASIFYAGFLFKFIHKLKNHQELMITIFNIVSYGTGLYGHYTGTGYFNNSSDTFYFAYTYALLERIVVDRVPTAFYKAAFYLMSTAVRTLIVPVSDKGLLFIQSFCVLTTIYFEYDQEKHYKTLFRSYFHSKEQLGKFKDLVENYIPEGIIVVTRDSMQGLFVNNAFKALFGGSKISDMRTQLDSFQVRENLSSPAAENLDSKLKTFPSNLNKTLLNLLEEKALKGHEYCSIKQVPYHLSFSNESHHNKEKIFEAKILELTWDEIPAIAVVLHDITQQQAILQLQIEADMNKDRVLATVSHELRTPLNGILGMIQIMNKKIQDQELLQYLKICKNSSNLLIGLVNSILDLNQIRFNKLRLSVDQVNVHELLKDIVYLFEYQCVQKNISLRLQISPQIPPTIVTDRNRLTQIFINLVGNALKFTSNGSITIIARESSRPEMIEFSVKDTGMGIRKEDQSKLFKMYGRLDHANTKINQQGVGLGLTISNSLAQILCSDDHLGGIKVESDYGKGSTFSFLIRKALNSNPLKNPRLDIQDTCPCVTESFFDESKGVDQKVKAYRTQPLKRNPGSIKILSAPQSPKGQLRNSALNDCKFNVIGGITSRNAGSTILIVDDNPFNVTVASHLVSSQGFNVKSALYGQTAIDIVLKNDHKAEPIQLILMDCQMPVMDGYETTRNLVRLMREGKIPEIPIVALTANNSAGDREECKKAGMCDYLHKPLTEANLINILKKYSSKY